MNRILYYLAEPILLLVILLSIAIASYGPATYEQFRFGQKNEDFLRRHNDSRIW